MSAGRAGREDVGCCWLEPLCLISRLGQPTQGMADSLPLTGQKRPVSSGQPPPPSAHSALTQKLVEDVGDRVVPAALEEGQASWGHGFLVLLVEIKCAEGPLGKLVTEKMGESDRGEVGTGAPPPQAPLRRPQGLSSTTPACPSQGLS